MIGFIIEKFCLCSQVGVSIHIWLVVLRGWGISYGVLFYDFVKS